MIHIDTSTFSPSANWQAVADNTYATMMALPDLPSKLNFIDQNAKCWRNLKSELPYSEKCWISEAIDCVSPLTIEHFRPKRAVGRVGKKIFKKINLPIFQEKQRTDWTISTKFKGLGYWWLAFDYRNFRCCGLDINSIKSIRFPLYQSSIVAYSETDDHINEYPILLDPTQPNDPNLITFDSYGYVKPSFIDITVNEYIRASISIEIYGLNALSRLVEKRKTRWNNSIKLINDINYFYQLVKEVLNGTQDLTIELAEAMVFFDEKCKDLKKYISPSAEFSAVTKTCVLSYKTNYDWINTYILNETLN